MKETFEICWDDDQVEILDWISGVLQKKPTVYIP